MRARAGDASGAAARAAAGGSGSSFDRTGEVAGTTSRAGGVVARVTTGVECARVASCSARRPLRRYVVRPALREHQRWGEAPPVCVEEATWV